MVGIGDDLILVQLAQLRHQQVGVGMRHDVVDGGAQHVGRRQQRRRVLDRLEAVAQHILDRHGAKTPLGDRQDRIIGRDQHQRVRRTLHRHLHRHPRAEAAADDGDAAGIDVGALAQPVEQHAAVVDHQLLVRIALRVTVAAVVHRQHCHAGKQLAGIARHPRHFLGAAAKIHHGRARPHHRRRHQPSRQLGAVARAQHHRAGAVAAAARVVDFALDGGIEYQPPLAGGDRRDQTEPQHAGETGKTGDFFGIVHKHQSTRLPALLLGRARLCAAHRQNALLAWLARHAGPGRFVLARPLLHLCTVAVRRY